MIQGFPETTPESPPAGLFKYRAGKQAAYSAVMATISQWLDELESNPNRE